MVLGPSLTVEYRTIVVPILRSAESEEALVAAARLATERRARIVIVNAIEVPLELPVDTRLPDEERAANEALDSAQALIESYGVHAVTRLLRARRAGQAIVQEASDRNAVRMRSPGSVNLGPTPAHVRPQRGRNGYWLWATSTS